MLQSQTMWRLAIVAALCLAQGGCYFFRKRSKGSAQEESAEGVLGQSLGSKAGGPNSANLAALYAITTEHAPAAVRPDPDVFVRRLLLQYRSEGATVAREIGRVEQYRSLLGGASEDFSTAPQLTYDATSLLAKMKVAEEVCQGLVAPTAALQPGWQTILPAAPSNLDTNLRFLAQRFLGVPLAEVDDQVVASLTTIVDAEAAGSAYANSHYIAACVALAVDADSLLF